MGFLLCWLALSLPCVALAQAQPPPAQKAARPEIQDLGNQRYRIGEIEIDKAKGEFTVPGQVLRDAPPLEFLVVTRGGYKAYEAVLEVNADAFQFNLACILIGLDPSHASPGYDKDNRLPVEGDPVEVLVSWFVDGKKIEVNGSDLIAIGQPPQRVEAREWVYTGSLLLNDGQYMADISGTLIGFVHLAESVIEHKQGVGLGNYGSVTVNPQVTPPVGTAIELTVRRPDAAG